MLSLFLHPPSTPSARALSRVAPPTMVESWYDTGFDSWHEFRHGVGGPVSAHGGAVIGFEGGIGHGKSTSTTMQQRAPLPATNSAVLQKSQATDFRYGTGGPVSQWGGEVIGFQGGSGYGNGVGEKAYGVVMPTSADEFRHGVGGPLSKKGAVRAAVGWHANGEPCMEAAPTPVAADEGDVAAELAEAEGSEEGAEVPAAAA